MAYTVEHVVNLSAAGHRPRPEIQNPGAVRWARQNLFYSVSSSVTTVVIAYLTITAVWWLIDWAVINAVWSVPHTPGGPDTQLCRDLRGLGACWAIIAEKHRLILFGLYPFEEQWRPAIVIALFIGLFVVSAMRRFWNMQLLVAWLAVLSVNAWLMWGGVFGLNFVPQSRWGGLALTLILATTGVAVAFPLSIIVAMGRRSELPVIKWLCVTYVEVIRGVPLISLLFMASVMFPLLMPEGVNLDKLLRAQIAIILFFSAYLAEVVRGGLQALPKGQNEAANALGLSYWQTHRRIILPQALRLVIPPLVNNFIGFFKDTSLVLIIGLYDLLAVAQVSIVEPAWQGFGTEVYIFVGAIYFAACFSMSRYSQALERRLAQNQNR